MKYPFDKKVGILGGGQLGKMLCLEAARLDIKLHILDKDESFPAAKLCHKFIKGDFTDYDDVLNFGMEMDIITIEIERVNIEALKELERRGKTVIPEPAALEIIQDKGLQKDFYIDRNIPTGSYRHFESKEDIIEAAQNGTITTPFVQKACRDGYDGKGVQVIKSIDDLSKLMDTKSIIEDLVDIDKEIAVIVARNPAGEIKSFPAVEMEFHPTANLVEYLCCPANITEEIEQAAQKLAKEVILAFDLHGLLAIEMFLTKDRTLLVNEVAPRPHNSGHHTLDASYTSQFEQHLRSILDLPLGDTSNMQPSVMVNLLGEAGYEGPVYYEGLDQAMNVPGAHILMYGKSETRPHRKMGHATVLADNVDLARKNAAQLKQLLNIKSKI